MYSKMCGLAVAFALFTAISVPTVNSWAIARQTSVLIPNSTTRLSAALASLPNPKIAIPPPRLTASPTDINSLAELRDALQRPGIKVIRFYATWCRSCARVAPLYRRLAETYKATEASQNVVDKATATEPIRFYNIVVNEKNPEMHAALGVPSLPYAHIYVDTMLVEEMRITKKLFPQFAGKINDYERGECLLKDEDEEGAIEKQVIGLVDRGVEGMEVGEKSDDQDLDGLDRLEMTMEVCSFKLGSKRR